MLTRLGCCSAIVENETSDVRSDDEDDGEDDDNDPKED